MSEDDRRVLAVWAADCAERVLYVFEARAPEDVRPREAIAGLRAFARRERKVAPLKRLSVAAHAAARAVDDPSAVAAARAAGQGAATAHMGAHALGAAAYATIAVRLHQPDEPLAVEAESEWQIEHATREAREAVRRLPIKRRAGEIGNRIVDLQEEIARMALISADTCR